MNDLSTADVQAYFDRDVEHGAALPYGQLSNPPLRPPRHIA